MEEMPNKVDKIEGKILSSNDFTDGLRQKLEKIRYGNKVTKVVISSVIQKNTNYTVPAYIVGNDTLLLFYEGCKLIKGREYEEIGTIGTVSEVIQFKDWDVPAGACLEILEIDLTDEVDSVIENDYTKLLNLPQINSVKLQGNKFSEDLHLQEELEVLTNLEIEEILKE